MSCEINAGIFLRTAKAVYVERTIFTSESKEIIRVHLDVRTGLEDNDKKEKEKKIGEGKKGDDIIDSEQG